MKKVLISILTILVLLVQFPVKVFSADSYEPAVIIIGDSYGQMTYGGIRNGIEVSPEARNDGAFNCWTGRLAEKLELSDTLVQKMISPESNCEIDMYEDNLIYSASGRGFWRKVNNINYESMIRELQQYVNADKVGLIVFGGGANDSKWYNQTIITNSTRSLIETTHQLYPNARIIIAQMGWGKYAEGELPEDYIRHGNWDDIIQKNVVPLGNDLEDLCKDYDYAYYAGNIGKDALEGHEDEYFTGREGSGQVDLIHPNYLGNEALAELLSERIKSTDISYLCEDYLGHNWSEWNKGPEATCTEDGHDYRECSRCFSEDIFIKQKTGHSYGEWVYNGTEHTHTHTCANDSSHTETQPCEFDEGVTEGNITTYTCKVCGGTYTVKEEGPINPEVDGVIRVAGANRFETSQAIASVYSLNNNVEKLDAVILANGDNFADALAGSYLAAEKNAPIIITRVGKEAEVNAYIRSILNSGGTIYVLGGTAAVPESCLNGLTGKGYDIKRLWGNNRYLTNLDILNHVGIKGDRILVATGNVFADSLSASATGLPMLLVRDDGLTDQQREFLSQNKGKEFIILGGNNAVKPIIESQLKSYGSVRRIMGANRAGTSIEIAKEFFPKAKQAVVAYSHQFPDGLCGGPLAHQISAPLILTRDNDADATASYLKSRNISNGYVLGGPERVSNDLLKRLLP